MKASTVIGLILFGCLLIPATLRVLDVGLAVLDVPPGLEEDAHWYFVGTLIPWIILFALFRKFWRRWQTERMVERDGPSEGQPHRNQPEIGRTLNQLGSAESTGKTSASDAMMEKFIASTSEDQPHVFKAEANARKHQARLLGMVVVACLGLFAWGMYESSTPGFQATQTAQSATRAVASQTEAATDIAFAKKALESLAGGDTAAEDLIDWETFWAGNVNVGRLYRAQVTEQAKADFRRSFIADFARGFRATGAIVVAASNWRIQSHDSGQSVIAADGANGTLHLTIANRDGRQKLTSIQFSRYDD